MLDSIIKETTDNATASVIWMHGLASDGYHFADIVPKRGLPQNAAIRFIFPNAPMKPISIYSGEKKRAWCDLAFMADGVSLDLENPDIKGIEESSKQVAKLIDAEIEKGIKSENIFLIGFSQGAVIALHTAMLYPKKLAGAVCLSSHFPTVNTMPLNGINAKLPVFFGHGNNDDVVPAALSEKTFEFLKSNGNPVERHIYNMRHTVCLDELKAIGAWIGKLLAI
jgi:phospholipase/carboxylesterase